MIYLIWIGVLILYMHNIIPDVKKWGEIPVKISILDKTYNRHLIFDFSLVIMFFVLFYSSFQYCQNYSNVVILTVILVYCTCITIHNTIPDVVSVHQGNLLTKYFFHLEGGVDGG